MRYGPTRATCQPSFIGPSVSVTWELLMEICWQEKWPILHVNRCIRAHGIQLLETYMPLNFHQLGHYGSGCPILPLFVCCLCMRDTCAYHSNFIGSGATVLSYSTEIVSNQPLFWGGPDLREAICGGKKLLLAMGPTGSNFLTKKILKVFHFLSLNRWRYTTHGGVRSSLMQLLETYAPPKFHWLRWSSSQVNPQKLSVDSISKRFSWTVISLSLTSWTRQHPWPFSKHTSLCQECLNSFKKQCFRSLKLRRKGHCILFSYLN